MAPASWALMRAWRLRPPAADPRRGHVSQSHTPHRDLARGGVFLDARRVELTLEAAISEAHDEAIWGCGGSEAGQVGCGEARSGPAARHGRDPAAGQVWRGDERARQCGLHVG